MYKCNRIPAPPIPTTVSKVGTLTGAHLGFLIRQGSFPEARAQYLFIFQIKSDKIRAQVVILDLRGLKFCNIFNGTIMVGAVVKILEIMLSILF